jgi:O-glycosyl hydrolase
MQGGRDYGIDSAIVTATVMHQDFTELGATSWQHWIAVSEVDYCDGLIYINIPEKTFEMTKRYYVTGNYTKYVKRGARRIEASCGDSDILLTAFKQGEQVVLVAVNIASNEKQIEIPAKGEILVAVTDENNDLSEKKINSQNIVLTPRSVTTIVW